MKTSQQQFEMMVTFMEEHGDISNPVKCARGKLRQLRLWEELRVLLNSEGSGSDKSIEKWKKVWADYKSNTKKKAGRLYKAAGGTGGGPAIMTKLTDLESRTLGITGIEAATGLQVVEAGFSQEVHLESTPQAADSELAAAELGAILAEVPEHPDSNVVTHDFEIWTEPSVPGPSGVQHLAQAVHRLPSDSPPPVIDLEAERLDDGDQQEERRPAHAQPALAGQTTPRRRAVRGRGATTPRRLYRRATAADQAAEHFLNSDAEWRQQRLQQQQNELEIRREGYRIREMEIESQRIWQQIGHRALDLIEKVVDKYCIDK